MHIVDNLKNAKALIVASYGGNGAKGAVASAENSEAPDESAIRKAYMRLPLPNDPGHAFKEIADIADEHAERVAANMAVHASPELSFSKKAELIGSISPDFSGPSVDAGQPRVGVDFGKPKMNS